MLSAVAARKARLAQSGQPEKHSTSVSVALTSAEAKELPSEKPKSARKPTSKRKSSQGPPAPPEKKKKRVKHDEKRPRYFGTNVDSFARQEDVIVIEDDASSSSEEEEQDVILPAPGSQETATGKRAWSPSNPLYDSSDDEAKDIPLDELLDIPVPSIHPQPSPSAILSTYTPIHDQNFLRLSPEDAAELGLVSSHNRDSVSALLALALDETISLLGVYTVTVVAGSVSLCGTTLSASPTPHRVFAPRSSPLPLIKCVSSDSDQGRTEIPESLRQITQTGGSAIWLEELRCHVEGLGRICRTFDGVFNPSRWQGGDTGILGVNGVHLIHQSSRDTQAFSLSASWESSLTFVMSNVNAEEMKPKVCLVKGPKNAGKSTFARTLLNRLLTRYSKVAFLECDLGQSEFTPGGMVALNVVDRPVFGPPFTHMSIPNRAHYIGSSSPRSSPSHYLSSIHSLLQTYRLDIQFSNDADPEESESSKITSVIPLVVNTMGWTKGLGADLTRKIEEIVEPTDVFEFEAAVTEYTWPTVPSSRRPHLDNGNARYHSLDPVEPSVLSTNFSASDHRTISILSYFHSIFPSQNSSSGTSILPSPIISSWSISVPICAQRPYEVDWTEVIDSVYLTGAGSEDVVPCELLRVLNGAIVGLVSCEQGTLDIDMDDADGIISPETSLPYTRGAAPPSPLSSHCTALALVRGVSPSSPHLHVLTPVQPNADARVLVKGELELPVWGMMDFRVEDGASVAGVERALVPYLRWGKEEGLGGERRRVRRNLMRRGLM